MDRDTWAGLYRRLALAYNKPLSAEHAGVLFDGLDDLTNERVTEAVQRQIRTSKHFPNVADLREICTAIAAESWRNTSPVAHIQPMTDEQRDNLLKAIRDAKARLGWA